MTRISGKCLFERTLDLGHRLDEIGWQSPICRFFLKLILGNPFLTCGSMQHKIFVNNFVNLSFYE